MDLSPIAELPEVKSAVVCDPSGALLDSVREADPETAGAVLGYLTSILGGLGEELGLGPLYRMSVAGAARATLIVVMVDSILSAAIEPSSAFPAVEHAVDRILQG